MLPGSVETDRMLLVHQLIKFHKDPVYVGQNRLPVPCSQGGPPTAGPSTWTQGEMSM
jgi:hypothetical protein